MNIVSFYLQNNTYKCNIKNFKKLKSYEIYLASAPIRCSSEDTKLNRRSYSKKLGLRKFKGKSQINSN